MSKITKLAKGAKCRVRLPGCLVHPETVVAAHYRSIRLGAGTGFKNDDLLAAHACDHCHSVVDGRVNYPGMSRMEIRLAHAEGVLETILALVEAGKVAI